MARRKSKKNEALIKTVEFIVITVFVVFVGAVAIKKTIYVFRHAELFNVKEVSLAPSLQFIQSHYLDRLVGKNIFEIDLKKTKQRLKAQYPEVEKLRIIRKLPNRIYVFAKKRDPFACMDLNGQNIILDNKAVVLSIVSKESGEKLPVIMGAPLISGIVLGKPVRDYRLRLALKIIGNIQNNEYLKNYRISSVNVGSLSQVLVYLNDDIKIIMDQDDIEPKISKLGIFLSQGNIDEKNFNYIDLRFKEIYLGQKTEN